MGIGRTYWPGGPPLPCCQNGNKHAVLPNGPAATTKGTNFLAVISLYPTPFPWPLRRMVCCASAADRSACGEMCGLVVPLMLHVPGAQSMTPTPSWCMSSLMPMIVASSVGVESYHVGDTVSMKMLKCSRALFLVHHWYP